jgi:hypothetical protein
MLKPNLFRQDQVLFTFLKIEQIKVVCYPVRPIYRLDIWEFLTPLSEIWRSL